MTCLTTRRRCSDNKNILRVARACLYAKKNDDDACRNALQELVSCDNPAYRKRALRLQEQFQLLLSSQNSSAVESLVPLPSFFRSAMAGNVAEYYRFGHDPAESALSATDDASPLELATLVDKKVSFFFGGINDSRHVMATIMDVYTSNGSFWEMIPISKCTWS